MMGSGPSSRIRRAEAESGIRRRRNEKRRSRELRGMFMQTTTIKLLLTVKKIPTAN
jgi:hypothetical protein